jgi:predicted enzyme related to lactoylglutathione lyase
VEDESSEWSYLVDAKGAGVPLFLQVVPEAKSVKNRVHLDYASTDAQAEAERLSALGATIVSQTTQESGPFFVMADPEGNEFCIAST